MTTLDPQYIKIHGIEVQLPPVRGLFNSIDPSKLEEFIGRQSQTLNEGFDDGVPLITVRSQTFGEQQALVVQKNSSAQGDTISFDVSFSDGALGRNLFEAVHLTAKGERIGLVTKTYFGIGDDAVKESPFISEGFQRALRAAQLL